MSFAFNLLNYERYKKITLFGTLVLHLNTSVLEKDKKNSHLFVKKIYQKILIEFNDVLKWIWVSSKQGLIKLIQ